MTDKKKLEVPEAPELIEDKDLDEASGGAIIAILVGGATDTRTQSGNNLKQLGIAATSGDGSV